MIGKFLDIINTQSLFESSNVTITVFARTNLNLTHQNVADTFQKYSHRPIYVDTIAGNLHIDLSFPNNYGQLENKKANEKPMDDRWYFNNS